MELNAIEKYFIEKLENLEKENSELKKELEHKVTNTDTITKQVLNKYYSVSTYSWYIKEENYQEYERALKEKDYEWLQKNNYEISTHMWNYEIILCGETFYFHLYSNGEKLILNQVYPVGEKSFLSLENAQKYLLNKLEKDIAKVKATITEKKAE